MLESRGLALIGDSNQGRFDLLKEILDDEFLINAVNAKTFDELKARVSAVQWKIALVADDLPYSIANKNVSLQRYFYTLNELEPGIRLGCIVGTQTSIDLSSTALHLCYIHVPPTTISAEIREQIITEFGSVLRRASRPPVVNLENDATLREQVRLLSEDRSLEDGEKHLAHLIRDFFDCDEVEAAKLGQGLSGAKVFRIRPKKEGVEQGEFVLKLSSAQDLWKIILETKQHAKAQKQLGVERYKVHVADLKQARLPFDPNNPEDKYIVSYRRWHAICYDYLGGERFGKFIDLETALISSSEKLLEKSKETPYSISLVDNLGVQQFRFHILEIMLDWLCQNWYMNKDLTGWKVTRFWDTNDSLNRQYLPVPPYKLTGKNKGSILSFLDSQAAILGERLIPHWMNQHALIWQLVERVGGMTGINLLDQEFPVILSPAHGDLNANNILLWLNQANYPFLIDFPFYQESGHALQDFARLEVEIKLSLMDRQEDSMEENLRAFDNTYSQVPIWKEMEDHLISPNWHENKETWHEEGFKDNVVLSLKLIQLIRAKAMEVQHQACGRPNVPDFSEEYLPALLYHTIRAIGYSSLSIFKRLLAVYSAGSIISIFTDSR